MSVFLGHRFDLRFRQAGLLLKAEKAYQEAIRWDPAAGDARKALEEIRVQRAGRG